MRTKILYVLVLLFFSNAYAKKNNTLLSTEEVNAGLILTTINKIQKEEERIIVYNLQKNEYLFVENLASLPSSSCSSVQFIDYITNNNNSNKYIGLHRKVILEYKKKENELNQIICETVSNEANFNKLNSIRKNNINLMGDYTRVGDF